jgi:hypothetical protein
MSLRVLILAVAAAAALILPSSGGAMALEHVSGTSGVTRMAPGPGGTVWALGKRLLRISGDRRVHTGWRGSAGREHTRLASGPDGSLWLDVDNVPELHRLGPDGHPLQTFQLPVNPDAAPVDDLDVARSGVAWATATVTDPKDREKSTTYAMSIEPGGRVRMSKGIATTPSDVRPPTIAAVDGSHAWMGVRCGRVAVHTRAHHLVLGRMPGLCASHGGTTPVALRRGPDGALWQVLSDGRVRRTVGGRTSTLTNVGPRSYRVGLAFTGHGTQVHAWIQTTRRIVDVTTRRTAVHPLPDRLLPGEHSVVGHGIVADHRGGLWLATSTGVSRVALDRCGVRRVVGLSSAVAARALRAAGCRVRVWTLDNGERGALVVRRQSRPGGSHVADGTTIVLTAAHLPRCHVDPGRAKLLARTTRWVVSSTDSDRTGRSTLRSCDRKTGSTWTFADTYGDDEDSSYGFSALHGGFVLLVQDLDSGISHEGGDESTTLMLADLAHRRRTDVTSYGDSWWADADTGEGGGDAYGTRFDHEVLDASGDVAWLEPHAVQLRRHGAAKAVALDTDPTAAFADLTLTGGRVRWTRDGVAASATL